VCARVICVFMSFTSEEIFSKNAKDKKKDVEKTDHEALQ